MTLSSWFTDLFTSSNATQEQTITMDPMTSTVDTTEATMPPYAALIEVLNDRSESDHLLLHAFLDSHANNTRALNSIVNEYTEKNRHDFYVILLLFITVLIIMVLMISILMKIQSCTYQLESMMLSCKETSSSLDTQHRRRKQVDSSISLLLVISNHLFI